VSEEKKATEQTVEETKETAKKEKKTKKDKELEALKQELDSKNDLLLRTAAEFDNYKKRTDRERASIAEFAKANVIKEILPILDNIDRAALMEDKTSAEYIKGIELIVKQLESISGKIGIAEVAQVGNTFDPNCHEAVMHIEDENFGENVIAEVLQKGYKIGDTIIRPAMVKVAN
jgi:molecular chaperone GrpE